MLLNSFWIINYIKTVQHSPFVYLHMYYVFARTLAFPSTINTYFSLPKVKKKISFHNRKYFECWTLSSPHLGLRCVHVWPITQPCWGLWYEAPPGWQKTLERKRTWHKQRGNGHVIHTYIHAYTAYSGRNTEHLTNINCVKQLLQTMELNMRIIIRIWKCFIFYSLEHDDSVLFFFFRFHWI